VKRRVIRAAAIAERKMMDLAARNSRTHRGGYWCPREEHLGERAEVRVGGEGGVSV